MIGATSRPNSSEPARNVAAGIDTAPAPPGPSSPEDPPNHATSADVVAAISSLRAEFSQITSSAIADVEKRFLGAEILVAGGGPTIWVDTFREQVTGWWGTDKVQIYFQDNLGLNDYCGDLYDGH